MSSEVTWGIADTIFLFSCMDVVRKHDECKRTIRCKILDLYLFIGDVPTFSDGSRPIKQHTLLVPDSRLPSTIL